MLTDDQILRMMTPTPDLSALGDIISNAVQMDNKGPSNLDVIHQICGMAAQVGDESVIHLILTHVKRLTHGPRMTVHLDFFVDLCRSERVDMINYARPLCEKDIIVHGLIQAAQKRNSIIVDNLRPHVDPQALIKILLIVIDFEHFDPEFFEIVYKGCDVDDIRDALSNIENSPDLFKHVSVQAIHMLKARAQIDFDREKLTEVVDTIKPGQNQKKPKNLL